MTDQETVKQIRENAYMPFFLGFAGFSSKAAFDPSIMVSVRKRLSGEELNCIQKLIAERDKVIVMEAVASLPDGDDIDDPDADAGN